MGADQPEDAAPEAHPFALDAPSRHPLIHELSAKRAAAEASPPEPDAAKETARRARLRKMRLDAHDRRELHLRVLSGVVLAGVSGGMLWLGGLVWSIFALLLATGVLWEWVRLTATPRPLARAGWFVVGLVYIGIAVETLISSRDDGIDVPLAIIACVAATDIGAFVAGRLVGGAKIAPAISPSKTWAGLMGGMAAAGITLALLNDSMITAVVGAVLAIIAQAGDFFESWLKRRAAVKDSGNLIPGHGGLFDRLDGLIAVSFTVGIVGLVSGAITSIF